MNYFTIYIDEDGEPFIHQFNEDTIKKFIEDRDIKSFSDKLPRNGDLDTTGGNIFIIKGELVVPKPKTRIVEYEL